MLFLAGIGIRADGLQMLVGGAPACLACAAVYPTAIITKIVLAQLLAAWLGGSRSAPPPHEILTSGRD